MIIRHKHKALQRKNRIRQKLRSKNSNRLRLSVFRSNKKISAQIIDDSKSKTLIAVSEKDIKTKNKTSKSETAKKVGETLAQKAKKAKITHVFFDRGSYKYHGRVKALAEGARSQGLIF